MIFRALAEDLSLDPLRSRFSFSFARALAFLAARLHLWPIACDIFTRSLSRLIR